MRPVFGGLALGFWLGAMFFASSVPVILGAFALAAVFWTLWFALVRRDESGQGG